MTWFLRNGPTMAQTPATQLDVQRGPARLAGETGPGPLALALPANHYGPAAARNPRISAAERHFAVLVGGSGQLAPVRLWAGLRFAGLCGKIGRFNGPREDNEARHNQLASFSHRQDKQLEVLDERYYQCRENISVLLMQYAIEHREHFVRDTA